MEKARERRLQPGYVRDFLIPALTRLGGTVRHRETGRWQITRVPSKVQDQARRNNRWQPIPAQYERITFDTFHIRLDGKTQTTGVVLCDQVKSLDVNSRNAVFKEHVSDDTLEEAIDLICSFMLCN